MRRVINTLAIALVFLLLAGCGKTTEDEDTEVREEVKVEVEQITPTTGIDYETAVDTVVDFDALTDENGDIFAWLYFPATDIDVPVLQSMGDDDFYTNHNAKGDEDPNGSVYISQLNLSDMCDFNTVINGKAHYLGGLTEYLDNNYFDSKETYYLYMDGNLLTYEVIAAFRDSDIDFLSNYNFTTNEGCNDYIKELFVNKKMGKLTRQGWEGLNSNYFLTTIKVIDIDDTDDCMYLVGALVEDAAGVIDRAPFTTDSIDTSSFESSEDILNSIDLESLGIDIE